MSKVVQYATNDAKVYLGFKKVNLKAIQTLLQKKIIWTKKSGKGKQECKYVCIIVNTSKVVQKSFENMFCFENYFVSINSWIPKCITHMLCMVARSNLSSKMSVGQTWVVIQTIDDTLLLVVK